MTDFLTLALEQGQDEEKEKEVPFEFGSVGNQVLGASFVQKRPPDPQKAPEGESFDSLPLWTSPLNDQRRGGARQWRATTARPSRQARPAAPLPLETSPSFSNERLFTTTAYSVTPLGSDRLGVLTDRVQAPWARAGSRARSEGQEPGRAIHSGELSLLSAVRRAERAVSFVQGPRRNWTVTLPETLGGEDAGLTVEALDRAVERDARRYDGQSVFY